MMNFLICNVGNSDVQIPLDRLPESLQAYARNRQQIPERLRVEELLTHYDQYKPFLQLALIRKAVRHVEEQTGALPEQIILIASDQLPPPATEERFYQADTIITADLIKRLLVDQHHIPETSIVTWLIQDEQSRHNPADYDGVMRSMERQLAKLRRTASDARCYLEVTGGTPAMTTALLIAGTKILGKQAIPIYITQNSEMAYSLNTGRTLLQHTVQEVIFSDLAIYSYGSASKTYEEHSDLFRDYQNESIQQLTGALLHYANQRLNLDFQSCRRSLSGQDSTDGGRYRIDISPLYEEVARPDEAWLLREVYYGAKIKYDRGEYADFVGRIFRFHEGCLRYLVKAWGGRFGNEQGTFFDRSWLSLFPSLERRISRNRSINRNDLTTAVKFLAEQRGNDQEISLCEQLDRIDGLAALRNRTQIAHGYTGLSRQILADYFVLTQSEREANRHAPADQADQIIVLLGEIYTRAIGQSLGENPFDGINDFLKRLLQLKS